MEKCGIVQCYYNHDGRCGIVSFEKIGNVLEKAPNYCPRRNEERSK